MAAGERYFERPTARVQLSGKVLKRTGIRKPLNRRSNFSEAEARDRPRRSRSNERNNWFSLFVSFCYGIILSNDNSALNDTVTIATDTDRDQSRRRCCWPVQVQVSSRMFPNGSITHARSAILGTPRSFSPRLSHCVLINATRAKGHEASFLGRHDPQQSGQKSRDEIGRRSAKRPRPCSTFRLPLSRPGSPQKKKACRADLNICRLTLEMRNNRGDNNKLSLVL